MRVRVHQLMVARGATVDNGNYGIKPVDKSGARAESDQRVHIWGKPKKRGKTVSKKTEVYCQHRNGQGKLGCGKNQRLVKYGRGRQTYHAPHRNIHQERRQPGRPVKPLAAGFGLGGAGPVSRAY